MKLSVYASTACQRASSEFSRVKRMARCAVVGAVAFAINSTCLASATFLPSRKQIIDPLGNVRVIVDFHDKAHLGFPGRDREMPNSEPKRPPEPEFFHKEQTVALVADFEARHGVKRMGMTSWAGSSVTVYVSNEKLARILQDPLVRQVSEDEEFSFSAFAPPWYDYNYSPEWMSWGGDATNAKVSSGSSGRKIYIIDSGTALHDDLPTFAARLNVACGSSGNCNTSDPTTYPLVGCWAHATHVAGIIGAKAAGANKTTRGVYAGFPNLISLNITSRSGGSYDCSNTSPSSSTVGYALDYISWDNSNNNPTKIIHVANISLNPGGMEYINLGVPGTNWTKARSVAGGIWWGGIQLVAGTLLVQSSGNWPSVGGTSKDACNYAYRPGYLTPPTASDGILVVGAVNDNGAAVSAASPFQAADPSSLNTLAAYEQSTYGECVEIWAPGDRIVSTWGSHSSPYSVNGTTYTGNVYASGVTQGWAFLSGTSMAAPHVAAIAAWLADNNAVTTSAELEALVRASATQHGGAVDPAGYPVKVPRLP